MGSGGIGSLIKVLLQNFDVLAGSLYLLFFDLPFSFLIEFDNFVDKTRFVFEVKVVIEITAQ